MLHKIDPKMSLLGAVMLLSFFSLHAESREGKAGSIVDVFMGVELLYRDIKFDPMYDCVVNLTPAVKWKTANRWQFMTQVIVPVYNNYGGRYARVRPNMGVIAKEMRWGEADFMKVSGGLFSNERYGFDLKYMHLFTSWLAIDAQLGLTGYCSMAVDFEASQLRRATGLFGVNLYENRSNTQLRVRAGRFLYEDYGVTAEIMRHFRHCTVGLYGLYSDKGGTNGGFRITVMLPPYNRRERRVNVRPASNFMLTYNVNANEYAGKMYSTDPEENPREGNFDRGALRWGSNLMQADFGTKR